MQIAGKYIVQCGLVLLCAFPSFAQLDSMHWIPPLHTRAEPGPQYIYLSTPSVNPIEVFVSSGTGEPIIDCNGMALTSVIISNADPQVICFENIAATQLLIPRGELHRVLRDRGVLLSSSKAFYANVRVRSNNLAQAGSVTAKGSFGKGKVFRTGHLFSNNDPTGNKCHFFSIMATEDNTRVSFSDYDPAVVFENWTGPLPDIVLDKGECYLSSVYVNAATPANDNGTMGTLVTSNKDIVVNSGSWVGSPNGNIRDIGIDQIAPLHIVGKEYILVRGRGPASIESPTVVAHYDNTEVYISGQATPFAVLDGGEFVVIPESEYSGNGNMYIRTSRDVFVYQMMGGTDLPQTVGMNFIPPLSCLGQSFVNNIPFIGEIGPRLYTGGLFIVAKSNANVLINGITTGVTPSVIPGNSEYVTYLIQSGLSGHVRVESESPIQVGLFGFNGVAGYGGYFSGFEVISIDLDLEAGVCIDSIASFSINVDSLVWLKNGVVIPGENDSVLKVKEAGRYSVVGFNKDCPEMPDTSRVWEKYLSDSIFISGQTCNESEAVDTILTLKNVHGCDSIVRIVTKLLRSDSVVLYNETCLPEKAGWDTTYHTNLVGCDSVVYNFHEKMTSPTDTIFHQMCEGEVYRFAGEDRKTAGIFTEKKTNQYGCDSITTLVLELLPMMRIFLSHEICPGDSVFMAGRYFRDSGLFTIPLQSRYGCDSTIYLTVIHNPTPVPEIQGIEPYCEGDSITLSTGVYERYAWSDGSTGRQLRISGSQQVSLTVENEFGCVSTTSVLLPDPVSVNAVISKDDILCFGDRNGVINIEEIEGGIGSYRITVNKQVQTGQLFTGLDRGHYNIVIEDAIGCTYRDSVEITGPSESLWLDLGADRSVKYGESTTVRVLTNSARINQLNWFVNGSPGCAFCFEEEFTITEDVSIRVELIDENGCRVTDELLIRVIKDPRWFIPNAFTPNGDGVNDRFVIFGNDFVENVDLLEIYSRWGELIFKAEDIRINEGYRSWDGTFSGKLMNPGVFVYKATLRYKDGTREVVTGDVTLLH